MYKRKFIQFLCLSLFFTLYSFGQKTWYNSAKIEYDANDFMLYQKKNVPSNYSIMSLDINLFKGNLITLGKGKSQIIELPNDKGELKQFSIQETSNFEPALQAKFPNIRSYTAKGIDDPTAIAKLSFGTEGLHGVIHSGKHATVYIDPFTKDHKQYMVYSRNDLGKNGHEHQCLTEDKSLKNDGNLEFNRVVNDGNLRTYRLAIVTSGEYAQFQLNRQGVDSSASDAVKKAAVLSAINTSMTRINAIFEKDLGVTMVLVANNDQVIFLNSATDGITDGTASTMIDETQRILDIRIGDSNYDVGHIFSIGGAGLAGLGVVCRTGQKGRGVTGISNPVGDPYDVDYVAHELGHQFGATHTQSNSCNRTQETAVEVGSGSTIMGYAGICSPNVIGVGPSTGNSDDYFHAVSISQMQNYIQVNANCATLTNTNNAVPTANAGLDYTIPHSTPFKLTGVATDADGLNGLTYNWEQIDNESAQMPPVSTNFEGPSFRSLPSKDVPVRYFPNLNSVLQGDTPEWEVLASVAREYNFAFTVRDNHPIAGNTARDDVKITVASTGGFAFTSQQNRGETWDVGSTQTITWEVASTNTAPVNTTLVNVKMSTDGGLTFPITLAENTPNDGSVNVLVPNNPSTNVRLLIEPVNNIYYAVNAGTIVVNSTAPTFIISDQSGTQTLCNSGNQTATFNLDFNFVNGFNESVALTANNNPQGTQVTFNPSTISANGSTVMTVTNLDGLTPQIYDIEVVGTANTITQTLDVSLKIVSSTFNPINLTSPVDNALDVPLSANLMWDEDISAESYDVQVATDNAFANIVSSGNVATNSFTTTTLDVKTQYFWRVKPKNLCGEGSFSSLFSFTTGDCSICGSTGNLDYATSTTLVQFNTIDNASGKTVPYNDYTSISTNVKRGDTHNLSVSVNTDGNYRVQTKAWIDWNGDCVFDTSTEEYDLGSASNTENGVTDSSPFSITVPATAKLGSITMRISTKYTDPDPPIVYPTACELDFDGEVEDYTLVIEDATASIEDVVFEGFNLFPNPNSGTFTLQFDTVDTAKTTLELFDLSGRLVGKKVYQNSNVVFREEVHFYDVSKGIYLLKINNGNKRTTRKLIIN
ncbi:MAG: T9SS type A sorting domain-containing protein [Flavobacteriaceae bacterium]|nr:T9SS type A sorting domain-containing protein [Flavobacteriaceae bacterium]